MADLLARRIPGAQRIDVPDSGHMVNLEAPDTVNALLRKAILAQHRSLDLRVGFTRRSHLHQSDAGTRRAGREQVMADSEIELAFLFRYRACLAQPTSTTSSVANATPDGRPVRGASPARCADP
jgi:hypothetical protein